MEIVKQILIVSDGRKGHLNQSIALAKYLGFEYDVIEIKFKNRFFKLLSYLFDRIGFYTMSIFEIGDGSQNKFIHEMPKQVRHDKANHHKVLSRHPELVSGSKNEYGIVVSAGSSTYYAAKVIAKKLNVKSVAMMLPKGYRYNFDVIFAQTHDNPPRQSNIIEIPANFAYAIPQGIYKPKKKSIAIVIGGNNSFLNLDKQKLKKQLDFIVAEFKDHEIAITTSPRTPKDIEELVNSYHFDYEVIYSKNPVNPIPDFLSQCDTVFITSDSTSMISEAISFGESNIVVLPLETKKENKFLDFISKLQSDGYLYIFDGKIINKNKKIDLTTYIKGINL